MVDDDSAWAAVPKGGWLEAYSRWAYTVTDAPLVYHLGASLAVLSMAVDPTVSLHLGGPVPGTFWSMLIGEAATSRKTTAGRKAFSILTDAQPLLAGAEGHESSAAFVEDIADRPHQLIFFGEYGDFLAATAKGSYRAEIRDKLLRLWDGDKLEKRKRGETPIVIERPRVSIVACVAPGLLEKHTDEHDWTDGGMSRWVCFYARRTREEWGLPDDEAGRIRLVEHLRRIIDRPLGPCGGLEPAARERLIAWGSELGARADATRNRWLGPVYGRAGSVALKAALIASLDVGAAARCRGREWLLDDVSLQWGLRVAELHLLSVTALLPDLSLSPFARRLRSVVDAITGPGVRSYADVLRRVTPPQPKRDVDQCIELLTMSGQVFRRDVPGQGTYLTVHPEALATTGVQLSREIGTVANGVGKQTTVVDVPAAIPVAAYVDDVHEVEHVGRPQPQSTQTRDLYE